MAKELKATEEPLGLQDMRIIHEALCFMSSDSERYKEFKRYVLQRNSNGEKLINHFEYNGRNGGNYIIGKVYKKMCKLKGH